MWGSSGYQSKTQNKLNLQQPHQIYNNIEIYLQETDSVVVWQNKEQKHMIDNKLNVQQHQLGKCRL
jgi:hypothetical protein